MIILLTAKPGGGKSSYAVGVMMLQAEREGRPIFVRGIPELKVAHFQVGKFEEWVDLRPSEDDPDVMEPAFTFPPGSIVFIDEAQKIFPPRPNGQRPPRHIEAFETHRHEGIDIVVMTQDPTFVDNHVRKNVARHIHIRDLGILGRWFYEWPEATDPSQFRTAPIKSKYSLPRRAFKLYKSSSKHIKPIRSVPPALYLLAFAVVLVVGMGFYVNKSFSSKLAPAEVASESAPARHASGAISDAAPVITVADVQKEMIPRVADRPETAPIYDQLRQPKQMPQIAGCVRYEGSCTCYTQQGTKSIVSAQFCADYMAGDRPFNPYRESERVEQGEGTQRQQRGPTVATAPGNPPEWLKPQGRTSSADTTANNPAEGSPQSMQGSPQGRAG